MAFSDPRIMLAIETSQREASVAVRDARHSGHPVIHQEKLAHAGRHDDDLLPAIDRLFSRLQLVPADLKRGAVAVSIGPGGFTGLRIAISTAKMFGEALGAALVAVPSALVAAEGPDDGQGAEVAAHEILVALATKGGSAWVTRPTRSSARSSQGDPWRIVEEPGLVDAGAIEPGNATAVLADEHFPPSARERLMELNVPVIAPKLSAAGCLRAGMEMLRRGDTISAMALSPLYPRVPEAVALWRLRHGE